MLRAGAGPICGPDHAALAFSPGRMRNGGRAADRIDDAGLLRRHDHHLPRARRLRDLAAALGARPEDRAASSRRFDPFSRREPPPPPAPTPRPRAATTSCACPEPRTGRRRRDGRARAGPLEGRRRAGLAGRAPGSTRSPSIEPAFDARGFVEGAKTAYEMIVTAFAQGDRKSPEEPPRRATSMRASSARSSSASSAARRPRPPSSRSTRPRSSASRCATASRR